MCILSVKREIWLTRPQFRCINCSDNVPEISPETKVQIIRYLFNVSGKWRKFERASKKLWMFMREQGWAPHRTVAWEDSLLVWKSKASLLSEELDISNTCFNENSSAHICPHICKYGLTAAQKLVPNKDSLKMSWKYQTTKNTTCLQPCGTAEKLRWTVFSN